MFPFHIEPGVPDNVKLSSVSYSELNLTWEKPKDPNGIILGYVVTWKKVSDDRAETFLGNLTKQTTESNVTSFVIKRLGE